MPRLIARYSSADTDTISSAIRRYEAAVNEMPIPLNIATYAATHAGHLGISASVAPGTIHPANSVLRRHQRGAALQQVALMCVPPNDNMTMTTPPNPPAARPWASTADPCPGTRRRRSDRGGGPTPC